jgi:hypothetical protein
VDAETGQARKNLVPFIPRDRCVIDLLHLLLRCTDRLVHTAAVLCLRAHGEDADTDDKQLAVLNKVLAPKMAAAMSKSHISFSAPDGRANLWSLTRVNGSAYRKLLANFKFKAMLNGKLPDLEVPYQTCWDEFFNIYNTINGKLALTELGVFRVKNKIEKWFQLAVDDYINKTVGSLKAHKNKPLFLASFLLTPYFHQLLVHIPQLLKNGDLRTFAGQNFEKCNNDHRLYWQVSTKRPGEETVQILSQHLRVRLNPVSISDRTTKRLKCPCCEHPPFRYIGWLQRHMVALHPDTRWNARFLADRLVERRKAKKTSEASSKEFIHAVLDLAYPDLVAKKKVENSNYYKKTYKAVRKERKALWAEALALVEVR